MSTISNNNIILRSKNIVIENSRYDLSEYNSSIISGFQGSQGFQGILGFQGLPGSASSIGATGLQGPQGIVGYQGNQGIIGYQGYQGFQGYQGIIGFQGNQGIIGFQGNQGYQGYQGIIGFQGNQGRQGIIGPQGFQGFFGPTGGGGALGFYGSFYDTTTQTAPTNSTGYAFKLNTTSESYGVSIENNGSGNPTRIKVLNSGVYNIQFSAQLDKSAGSTAHIEIWLRKNGTDVPDSATIVAIQGTNAETVPAWNFMLTLNANDYVELMWRTDDTNLLILYEPATSIRPLIPSLIVTVQQVMNTQSGPTGPSYNLTPFLSVYSNINDSLPGSYTYQLCKYNVIQDDPDSISSWFNTSTYRFTPLKSGWWQIIANYDVFRGTGNEAGLSISKNGTSVAVCDSIGSIAINLVKNIYMNGTTDYIEIFNFGVTTQTRQQNSYSSFCQFQWLRS